MAQQWFRRVEGQTVGPLASKVLKDLASRGEIQPDEQILDDQSKKWVAAGKIHGLVFHTTTARPPAEVNGGEAAGVDQIELPPAVDFLSGADIGTSEGFAPRPTESLWDSKPSSPEVQTSPRPPGSALPAQGPRHAGLIVAAVVGAILLIGAACTGTYLLARGESKPAAPDRIVEVDKELKEERDRVRTEIEGLKGEIQELEGQRNDLEQDKNSLEKTKEQLDAEIKQLTTKREILNRWKGVDLVLMNSKQQAVGLKKQGTAFVVIDKQEGELAETVLAVSRNLHIARTVGHAQLARDVYNLVEPGKSLPPELEKRVWESVWRTHQFVQVRPDTSTKDIDLVVYRDAVTSEVRIGFLHESTKEGIRVEARGAPRELIPWKQIQPGSARHGTPDSILPMLGNVDFLEYSLLRVVQKIGTGDAAGVSPRLIVHCDIEISTEHTRHYEEMARQLADQSRPLDYYHAEGTLGLAFLFFESMQRASAVERSHSLWKEMHDTDPHQRARHLAQFVEDEVQSRMGQWGLPTVSDKDLTKFESGTTAIGKAVRAASLHDATHLLYVTVKASKNTGDYHMSVRLFDETGKDTWMNEGDRTLTPESRLERYHASSGDLVVLTLTDKQKAINSETPKGALESAVSLMVPEVPPVVTVGRSRGAKEQRSELVYLESSAGAKTRFRTLFNDQVKEIATGVIESTVPVKNPLKDVPQDLIYRYVTTRFAQQMLPPAGRVERVQGLTGEVVGLGTSQRVVPGERCRVLRSGDDLRSHSILPTEAELSDVGSAISRVTFEKSGFEEDNPDNVLMRQGDLLSPRDWKTRTVRVETLEVEEPISQVAGNLKFDSFGDRGTGGKYQLATELAADKVSRRIADALASAGISTSAPQYGTEDFPTTHKVYGTITLSPEMQHRSQYNPSSSPLFRVALILSEVNDSGSPLLVTFDISHSSL